MVLVVSKKKQYSVYSLCSFLLALIVLFICGCSNDAESLSIEINEFVQLSFSSNQFANVDKEEVSEIRLLVFDGKGNCVKNRLLSFDGKTSIPVQSSSGRDEISNPIKLAPGKYEFLFIANETSMLLNNAYRKNIVEIKSKSDLYKELFTHIVFSPNLSQESSVNTKLPMSAYYGEVNLEGISSSFDQPYRFPYKVSLVRAFAMIDLSFNNKNINHQTFKRIKSVDIINVASVYSVPALSNLYSSIYPNNKSLTLHVPLDFSDEDYKNKVIGRRVIYIPEFLRGKSETNKVSTLLFKGDGFYDYEMKLEENLHFDGFKEQAREIDFNLLSNASIIRNTKFEIDIILTSDRDLESVLQIMPWTMASSSIGFIPPKWNKSLFSIKVDNVERKQNQEIILQTGQEAVIKFMLNEPLGGIWNANLTNGAHFAFDTKVIPRGIAGTEYQFKIKSSVHWSGIPRFTEFYIAVTGKELLLWNDSEGLGNRFVFKQIE